MKTNVNTERITSTRIVCGDFRQVSVFYRVLYKNGKSQYRQYYDAALDTQNIVEDVKNCLVREWGNKLNLNYGDFNDMSHIKLIAIDGIKVNEIIQRTI